MRTITGMHSEGKGLKGTYSVPRRVPIRVLKKVPVSVPRKVPRRGASLLESRYATGLRLLAGGYREPILRRR